MNVRAVPVGLEQLAQARDAARRPRPAPSGPTGTGSGPAVLRCRTSSRPRWSWTSHSMTSTPRRVRLVQARPASSRPGGRSPAGLTSRGLVASVALAARSRRHGAHAVADQHQEPTPADHVEHVVVGGRDHRPAPSAPASGSRRPAARRDVVAVKIGDARPAGPSPTCRLGIAAYWFTNAGGCRYAVGLRGLGHGVDVARGPPAAAAPRGRTRTRRIPNAAGDQHRVAQPEELRPVPPEPARAIVAMMHRPVPPDVDPVRERPRAPRIDATGSLQGRLDVEVPSACSRLERGRRACVRATPGERLGQPADAGSRRTIPSGDQQRPGSTIQAQARVAHRRAPGHSVHADPPAAPSPSSPHRPTGVAVGDARRRSPRPGIPARAGQATMRRSAAGEPARRRSTGEQQADAARAPGRAATRRPP